MIKKLYEILASKPSLHLSVFAAEKGNNKHLHYHVLSVA